MPIPSLFLNLDEKGAGALPALDRLGAVDDALLHNDTHDLRHPKGVYSVSVGKIYSKVKACAENLEVVFNRATKIDDLANLKKELTKASEDIANCLYAAAEHVDDVEAVTLCFYPHKRLHERHPGVKTFKREMDRIRKPFSSKANFIKHHQCQVRLFSSEFVHGGWPMCVHGFFVEQYAGGVLGPSPVLHANGEKVLSVVSFLWDVIAYTFETSIALAKFIDGIAPTTDPAPVDSESFANAFVAVARLPNYVMDGKHPFKRVNFSLGGSKKMEATLDSGLYGSIRHPWADTHHASLGSWMLAYDGDGVSKAFAFVTPQKIYVQNWDRPPGTR